MSNKIDIFESDEIGLVIDFLKIEKNITDIVESNGISTISSDSLCLLRDCDFDSIFLKVGQIVTINKINYPVLSVNYNLKTFTIKETGLFTMSTGTPSAKTLLVDKWNLAINYKFGSRIEINDLLAKESANPDTKLQRFPLIWLFINNPETSKELDFDHKSTIKMAFVGLSDIVKRAEARQDDVIKPILKPLLNLFLQAIKSTYFAYKFNWEFGNYNFKKYYRYFYGSSDKNEMVLSTPTDAIEIELDITFQNQYS
jgi:hypothetical protein